MAIVSKLVVLCDDIWCSAMTEGETNLSMVANFMGIDFEKGQDSLHEKRYRARYFPGPGLGNPFDLVLSGKLGHSIATRCVDVYEYIVANFTEGHEIWMFGAGQGGYVIRCVAGMIEKCGIVKVPHEAIHDTRMLACRTYILYANQASYLPSILRFRITSGWRVERPIKFIGLFDATGPKSFAQHPSAVESTWSLPPPCHDVDFGRVAEHVYHAVAIHERLPFFHLYPLPPPDDTEKQTNRSPSVCEKWFPGTHYDLARQEFSFQRGRIIANMSFSSWLLGQRVRPNTDF